MEQKDYALSLLLFLQVHQEGVVLGAIRASNVTRTWITLISCNNIRVRMREVERRTSLGNIVNSFPHVPTLLEQNKGGHHGGRDWETWVWIIKYSGALYEIRHDEVEHEAGADCHPGSYTIYSSLNILGYYGTTSSFCYIIGIILSASTQVIAYGKKWEEYSVGSSSLLKKRGLVVCIVCDMIFVTIISGHSTNE